MHLATALHGTKDVGTHHNIGGRDTQVLQQHAGARPGQGLGQRARRQGRRRVRARRVQACVVRTLMPKNSVQLCNVVWLIAEQAAPCSGLRSRRPAGGSHHTGGWHETEGRRGFWWGLKPSLPAAASSAARHSGTSGRAEDRPMSSTNRMRASISVMAGPPPPPLEPLCCRRRADDPRRSCGMLPSALPLIRGRHRAEDGTTSGAARRQSGGRGLNFLHVSVRCTYQEASDAANGFLLPRQAVSCAA